MIGSFLRPDCGLSALENFCFLFRFDWHWIKNYSLDTVGIILPSEQLTQTSCFLNRGSFLACKIISNKLSLYWRENKYMSGFSHKLSLYQSITIPLDCSSHKNFPFVEGTAWFWLYFSDKNCQWKFSLQFVGEQLQVVSVEVLFVFFVVDWCLLHNLGFEMDWQLIVWVN